MGERTYVNVSGQAGVSKAQRSLRVRFDIPLALSIITLTVFGLLMVASTGWQYSIVWLDQEPTYMISRQLLWVLLGAVLAVALSFIDYHRYQRLLLPMMGGTILLLVVVLVVKDTSLGANRSFFGGSVRPSELAKLATIIYLSFWLFNKRDVLGTISLGLFPMTVLLGIISGFVFAQPDLSAGATILFLGAVLYFLAGGALRQVMPIVIVAGLVGWLVLTVVPTGRDRLINYVAGLQNPVNASYHVQRSLEAIVNGGIFGVGIGRASTKFTGLPVAPTDSIFAVIAEETGLLGASLVVVLFLIFLWRGLKIARNAPDLLGRLLASGLTIWIMLEAIINMGGMVNLVPFAGNALPFISAGGSSLVMMLASVGIIMNIARTSGENNPSTGRTYSAVVDLRGRNGRRSVSRFGRSASTR